MFQYSRRQKSPYESKNNTLSQDEFFELFPDLINEEADIVYNRNGIEVVERKTGLVNLPEEYMIYREGNDQPIFDFARFYKDKMETRVNQTLKEKLKAKAQARRKNR